MSNLKSTYLSKNGKASLSQEEILEAFNKRRQENISKIVNTESLSFKEKWPGGKEIPVTIDEETEAVSGCFCSYCKEYLKGEDPWSRGVYIFPTCRECLTNVKTIEDYLSNRKGDNNVRVRKTMVDPSSVSVDWDNLEKLIADRQAKLSLLAKRYKVYPAELRAIIESKYGERVSFKRGRYGGIFWNDKTLVEKA